MSKAKIFIPGSKLHSNKSNEKSTVNKNQKERYSNGNLPNMSFIFQ